MTTGFEAVAEPARRRLLDLLMLGPRPVGELVAESGLSQPNTSRHLRVLREAGLVESRPHGQRRMYAVRPEGFAELARWLTPYVLLWQGGLGALEAHLERVPSRARRSPSGRLGSGSGRDEEGEEEAGGYRQDREHDEEHEGQ